MTTTGFPTADAERDRHVPSGVTFVDNGNGTATLSGTPAAGTGGTYPLTITAPTAWPDATQNFTLTVNAGAGDHQRGQHDVHGRHGGHVHGDDHGVPDPDPERDRGSAVRRDLRGQRRWHRDARRHARGGNRGAYALTITAANGVGTRRHPELHADGATRRRRSPAPAARRSRSGAAGTFTVTTTGFPPRR